MCFNKGNCDDALDLNANNTKALFRRGLANLAVNLPDAAKRDFEKVIQLEPNNSTVTQQLAICDKMIKENLKKEKQMYTKMFSSAGQKPKTVRLYIYLFTCFYNTTSGV